MGRRRTGEHERRELVRLADVRARAHAPAAPRAARLGEVAPRGRAVDADLEDEVVRRERVRPAYHEALSGIRARTDV